MAIINRDLSHTGQRSSYSSQFGVVATSSTYLLFNVSFAAQLIAITESVVGLSSTPNHSIWVTRFIVGTGTTTMTLGASMSPTDFGTSGMISYSLTQGTTFQLASGDVITLATAGANTAVASACINVVIRDLQDIRSDFGV